MTSICIKRIACFFFQIDSLPLQIQGLGHFTSQCCGVSGGRSDGTAGGDVSGPVPAATTSEWVDLLANMNVLPPRHGDSGGRQGGGGGGRRGGGGGNGSPRPLSGDEWMSVGLYSAIVFQRARA